MAKGKDEREEGCKRARGDKVTRDDAGEQREKENVKEEVEEEEEEDEELREAMVGWSHLLLAAHRPSSSRVGPRRVSGGRR